jgi:hypothetical protein
MMKKKPTEICNYEDVPDIKFILEKDGGINMRVLGRSLVKNGKSSGQTRIQHSMCAPHAAVHEILGIYIIIVHYLRKKGVLLNEKEQTELFSAIEKRFEKALKAYIEQEPIWKEMGDKSIICKDSRKNRVQIGRPRKKVK